MSWLTKARRSSYRTGRRLGDVQAVLHPSRLPRRAANKLLGRKVVRRIWR